MLVLRKFVPFKNLVRSILNKRGNYYKHIGTTAQRQALAERAYNVFEMGKPFY